MQFLKRFSAGLLVPCLFFAICLSTARSDAATLSYNFVAVSMEGGTATGNFSYDTNTLDLAPGPSGLYAAGGFNVSVSGGGYDGGALVTANSEITMGGGQGFVLYPNGVPSFSPFIQLASPINSGDEALPGSLNLVDFTIARLSLTATSLGLISPTGSISYDLISLNQQAPTVPLPSGLPLIATGVGVLALLRRRQGKTG